MMELNLNKHPIDIFSSWLDEAKIYEVNDPDAMSFSTVSDDGYPSVRMVLLRKFDKDGFIFFTNYNSRKSSEIKKNSKGALCFHWKSLRRQVRAVGKIEMVSKKESDDYYYSRPLGSRIGAWASKQSSILNNRDELLSSIEEFKKRYNDKDEVPRPDHWSGWNLIPTSIEFWLDGDNRIHERLKYTKDDVGKWTKSLLSP